jgi:predicted esterase
MSARHNNLFTAAITIAGSPGEEPLDRLGRIPTYVIHSRDDEVSPFEPTERAVAELKKRGRPVEFEPLEGIGHFDMGGYVDALINGGQWVAERWKK